MSLPRYAARTDKNQQEIIDALRKIGCSVVAIGTPVDLLCGHRKKNILLEVKRRGEKPRTQAQRQFLETWNGQVCIVTSAEQAIDAVTA